MTATHRDLPSRLPRLRRQLLDRRREIFARLEHIESDLRWLGANVEPAPDDEAQEEAAADMLLRLDEHGKAELAAIDGALALLARGGYGTCRRCHKAIPVARLEAMPEATACVPCG